MYILLPPSEGKSPAPGKSSFSDARPEWAADCGPVLEYLAECSPADRLRRYSVSSPEKAAAVHRLNQDALVSGALPALQRYTGVVYTHLDYPGLHRKTAAGKRILIVSALFGLIDGNAPIPEYKLPMNPWLARYWRPLNTARLLDFAGGKSVLNLLPQAYRKSLDYPNLLTVDFRVQGGKKAAGHFGKAIKGRFVRWILEKNIKNARDFNDFCEDGYRFDGTNFVQQPAP